MPAESSIEKRLVAYAKAHGIWTRKFSSPANAGVPDRVFCYKGVTLFMEIKAPGKKPTTLQWREIDLLVAQEIPATFVDTYHMGLTFLQGMCNGRISLHSHCYQRNAAFKRES